MKRMAEALRSQGASQAEVAHLVAYEGGLARFWSECADPTLLMRIASVLGLDPKVSVRIAIDAAKAVAFYVGPKEPRPSQAIAAAQRFVEGKAKAEECTRAATSAEEVARAYREVKPSTKVQKRAFRAASHAAHAAALAAFVARDAAVTMELEYDTDYTFEDAWDGARVSCALGAAQALLEAVEAGLSAESAKATMETGSSVAGGAASQEARPYALVWAASMIRAKVAESGLDPTKYAG